MGKQPTANNEKNVESNYHIIYNVLAFGPYERMIHKHKADGRGGNIGNYSERSAITSLNKPVRKEWWEL